MTEPTSFFSLIWACIQGLERQKTFLAPDSLSYTDFLQILLLIKGKTVMIIKQLLSLEQ